MLELEKTILKKYKFTRNKVSYLYALQIISDEDKLLLEQIHNKTHEKIIIHFIKENLKKLFVLKISHCMSYSLKLKIMLYNNGYGDFKYYHNYTKYERQNRTGVKTFVYCLISPLIKNKEQYDYTLRKFANNDMYQDIVFELSKILPI